MSNFCVERLLTEGFVAWQPEFERPVSIATEDRGGHEVVWVDRLAADYTQ